MDFFGGVGKFSNAGFTVKHINYISGILNDLEHLTQGQKWKFASIVIKLAIRNIPADVKCK